MVSKDKLYFLVENFFGVMTMTGLTIICLWQAAYVLVKELNTSSLGKVIDFTVVPGYGIKCIVRGIHMTVRSFNNGCASSNQSPGRDVNEEGEVNGNFGIKLMKLGKTELDVLHQNYPPTIS